MNRSRRKIQKQNGRKRGGHCGGLTPTGDDDAAGARQGRRKAYLPLSTEGKAMRYRHNDSFVRA